MRSTEDLTAAFEAGTLGAADFPHEAHVKVAWELSRRYEPEDAFARLCAGIRGIAARAGLTGLFHETITRAWFKLIAAVDDLGAHPELFDRKLLAQFYSPEVLASGRHEWVEPDLQPLRLAPEHRLVEHNLERAMLADSRSHSRGLKALR